jgi:hypothetical protein
LVWPPAARVSPPRGWFVRTDGGARPPGGASAVTLDAPTAPDGAVTIRSRRMSAEKGWFLVDSRAGPVGDGIG